MEFHHNSGSLAGLVILGSDTQVGPLRAFPRGQVVASRAPEPLEPLLIPRGSGCHAPLIFGCGGTSRIATAPSPSTSRTRVATSRFRCHDGSTGCWVPGPGPGTWLRCARDLRTHQGVQCSVGECLGRVPHRKRPSALTVFMACSIVARGTGPRLMLPGVGTTPNRACRPPTTGVGWVSVGCQLGHSWGQLGVSRGRLRVGWGSAGVGCGSVGGVWSHYQVFTLEGALPHTGFPNCPNA